MDVDGRVKLMPPITEANRPFWEGAAVGELRLQICGDCQKARFPESPVCPHCLSSNVSWDALSGRGRVWSWIVMHHNYLPAFSGELPYAVLLVTLEEGPSMMSGFVGDPETLAVDLPVEIVFKPLGEERHIAMFQPAL
jgi:uncharacterized OB-fold protein